jgi:putative acetyltransferase
MGGYKIIAPAEGEVKSMHVTRGRARAGGRRAICLDMIVNHARAARACTRLSLETGSLEGSAAARRLYEKAGFTYCPPFGSLCGRPDERLHDPHALIVTLLVVDRSHRPRLSRPASGPLAQLDRAADF